jgi:hypothetical protein
MCAAVFHPEIFAPALNRVALRVFYPKRWRGSSSRKTGSLPGEYAIIAMFGTGP